MSYEVKLIGYESLNQAMMGIKTEVMPAELQGIAFGFVCLNNSQQAERIWAKFLLDEFQDILDDPEYIPFLEMMGHLFRGCQQDLITGDYGITLCLPDDESNLHARMVALSAWCKGFLYGLGIAGQPSALQHGDIQEALGDISAIIEIDHDSVDGPEGEGDFEELVEYVKLVPVLIYQHQAKEYREETIH